VRKEEQRERGPKSDESEEQNPKPVQARNYHIKSNFSSLEKTRWKGSKIFSLQGELGDLTDAWGEPGCYRDKNVTLFLIFCTLRLKQGL
jgi:hypothetical protein